MTDQERDELDSNVKRNLSDYSEALDKFRSDIEKEFPYSSQTLGVHLKGVLLILQHRLELITRLFTDQRSLRLKQLFEEKEGGYFTKKSKLAQTRTSSTSTPSLPRATTLNDPPELEEMDNYESKLAETTTTTITANRRGSSPTLSTPSPSSTSSTSSSSSTSTTPAIASFTKKVFGGEELKSKLKSRNSGEIRGEREENELTEEELRELEQENKTLLRDFDRMVDQTRQIER
jgi:hypothetical protein